MTLRHLKNIISSKAVYKNMNTPYKNDHITARQRGLHLIKLVIMLYLFLQFIYLILIGLIMTIEDHLHLSILKSYTSSQKCTWCQSMTKLLHTYSRCMSMNITSDQRSIC